MSTSTVARDPQLVARGEKARLWLEKNDAKIRRYANALSKKNIKNIRIDPPIFDADDFYQNMYMKIFVKAQMDEKFMDKEDS
ncbi:MAG TPA: hypothetical protein DIW23_05725, partial [Anaerolineae bacterium]|nr:hypothetical protein [Anaerolineae bacterium]